MNTTYETANETVNQKVPGRTGSIARLIVMWLFSLGGFALSFFTLPEYIGKLGFARAFLDSIGGFGLLLLTAAFFWGIMKWLGFSMPRAFRAAKRFWARWIPLTVFGLVLKAYAFIFIVFLPAALGTSLFAPLALLSAYFAKESLNLFSALLLLLAGAAIVVLFSYLDICKLRGISPLHRFSKEEK